MLARVDYRKSPMDQTDTTDKSESLTKGTMAENML